ncbi:MAG TPA: acyl-CoA dehydrogenase family protein [Fimbriimonas sp.]|nr:acyl-CoA dehydrogenase family protein [Fimbriimonas sp.]
MSTTVRNDGIPVGGGCFLSGDAHTSFSPEDFSSDEKMMIETAEQFCRAEVMTRLEAIDAQEEGLMPKLIKQAGDLGLCGIDSPEEYGGLGLGKNLAARILEFMSLNGSMSVTYGITSGISQVGLSLFGSHEQKEKYLPLLASGEWIGAYALSEPNAGSDALSVTTTAVQKGDKWVLNGTKMWISNAKWANLFLVMAKIDGEQFSAFLVERDTPGLIIEREEHKLGLKGSSTARITLDNAEIPLENLLYEPGKGHHVAFNALNIGRFKLSSMSIGPARHAIEVAADYAYERRQFGQPLASFELIAKKLQTMKGLFFVAESMIYRTGALIDSAFDAFGGSIDGNRKAAEEFAIECSACKVFSTEAEDWIIDEALQIFGGYGFTEEFPMARHYRDARVSRIYEGTNEINRIFLADRFQRKMKAGTIPALIADSWISEMAVKALHRELSGQVQTAAASDLLLISFAEQSARFRAHQTGQTDLYEAAMPTLKFKAAQAWQTISGEPVLVP